MAKGKKRPRGRPRSKPSPGEAKKKRKQWTNESMLLAMQAVKDGVPLMRAAVTHGVPRSTLQDRIHGRVEHGTLPGRRCYLSSSEENELVDFIVEVADAGYGKTRKEITAIATREEESRREKRERTTHEEESRRERTTQEKEGRRKIPKSCGEGVKETNCS